MEINSEYEEVINSNNHLKLLLKEKGINTFSNFSDLEHSSDFKEYIKEDYEKSFYSLFDRLQNTEKNSALNSLFKSVKFLATPESKSNFENYLLSYLDSKKDELEPIKNIVLSGNEKLITEKSAPIDEVLNVGSINIFNHFSDHPQILDHKNRVLKGCLEMCDILAQAKPKKETMKYMLYNVIMNRLDTVTDFGDMKSSYENHSAKIENTRKSIDNKYTWGIVLFVVFLVIRIIMRLSN